jgi:hypothetical protein
MTNEACVEILLIPEGDFTAEKLKHQLESSAEWDPSISLEIRQPSNRTLGPDVSFITVSLPCVTAVLLALIKAITEVTKARFEVTKEQSRTEVRLELPGEGVIVVKGTMALKELDRILQQLKPKTIIRVESAD